MNGMQYRPWTQASDTSDGVTLPELLIALLVASLVLATVVAALVPTLDVVQAVPEAADLEQRARGAERVIGDAVRSAGAGADLLGLGPLTRFVPAVWPLRLGMSVHDTSGTAFGDRLTLLHSSSGAAQAPLAAPMSVGNSVVSIAWHPACGVDPSCGFRRGDEVVVFNANGDMDLAIVSAATGTTLIRTTPAARSVNLPAQVLAVSADVWFFDGVRRQLRRADARTFNQPVIDDVVAMSVRHYGSPAPPRWPSVPGSQTCVVNADGTPRLGLLGPVPGPLVELALSDLTDGPWCGGDPWLFDADLMRVRAVRVTLRLQAFSPSVRGLSLDWFTHPGSARRPGQQVRDLDVEVFVSPPNLALGS